MNPAFSPGKCLDLPYGNSHVKVTLEGVRATVLTPQHAIGLENEKEGFGAALESPIGARPLRELVKPGETVALAIPDMTRPFPSHRVLPWLFEAVETLTPENVVIVVGTGSHRANTRAELVSMLGEDIVSAYRVVNHNAHDPSSLAYAGRSRFGYDVHMNKEYVQADRRILLGFIEPHFMAGFSGGYKAAFPGVAGIDAIMRYHSAEVIGDPLSSWGNLKRNPTQEHVRAGGSLLPADFLVNVALNRERAITGWFCGEVVAAHEAGCAFVKETAMVACERSFPIVVTTNNGFPLDQNLYQAVKGMSAAAQIVAPGGLIIVAAECADGFPDHGNFKQLLFEYPDPHVFLEKLKDPAFSVFDQWQNQLFAQIAAKARIAIKSGVAADEVERAGMIPIESVDSALRGELARIGWESPVAVLPEGPVTVPYLQDGERTISSQKENQ